MADEMTHGAATADDHGTEEMGPDGMPVKKEHVEGEMPEAGSETPGETHDA